MSDCQCNSVTFNNEFFGGYNILCKLSTKIKQLMSPVETPGDGLGTSLDLDFLMDGWMMDLLNTIT